MGQPGMLLQSCNTRKAIRPLAQFGVTLRNAPARPKYVPFISLTKFMAGTHNDVWRDYLPAFGGYGRESSLDVEAVAHATG